MTLTTPALIWVKDEVNNHIVEAHRLLQDHLEFTKDPKELTKALSSIDMVKNVLHMVHHVGLYQVMDEVSQLLGALIDSGNIDATQTDVNKTFHTMIETLFRVQYLIDCQTSGNTVDDTTSMSALSGVVQGKDKKIVSAFISGRHQATVEAVLKAVKEDALSVKDNVDLYIRTADPQHLKDQSPMLFRAACALRFLEMPQASQSFTSLSEQLQSITTQAEHSSQQESAFDVVSGITNAEATILEETQYLISEHPRPFQMPFQQSVLNETLMNIARVKSIISDSEESNQWTQLQLLGSLCDDISGTLSMLGLSDVAQFVDCAHQYASDNWSNIDQRPNGTMLEQWITLMVSVECCLEAYRDLHPHPHDVLHHATQSCKGLGLSAPDLISGHSQPQNIQDNLVDQTDQTDQTVSDVASEHAATTEALFDVIDQNTSPSQEVVDVVFDHSSSNHAPVRDVSGAPDEEMPETSTSNIPFNPWKELGLSVVPMTEDQRTEDQREDKKITEEHEDTQHTEAFSFDFVSPDFGAPGFASTASNGDVLLEPFDKKAEMHDDLVKQDFYDDLNDAVNQLNDNIQEWALSGPSAVVHSNLRSSFHLLKGSSFMVGAIIVGDICSKMETVCNALVEQKISAQDNVQDPAYRLIVSVHEALSLVKRSLDGETLYWNPHALLEQAQSVLEPKEEALPDLLPAALEWNDLDFSVVHSDDGSLEDETFDIGISKELVFEDAVEPTFSLTPSDEADITPKDTKQPTSEDSLSLASRPLQDLELSPMSDDVIVATNKTVKQDLSGTFDNWSLEPLDGEEPISVPTVAPKIPASQPTQEPTVSEPLIPQSQKDTPKDLPELAEVAAETIATETIATDPTKQSTDHQDDKQSESSVTSVEKDKSDIWPAYNVFNSDWKLHLYQIENVHDVFSEYIKSNHADDEKLQQMLNAWSGHQKTALRRLQETALSLEKKARSVAQPTAAVVHTAPETPIVQSPPKETVRPVPTEQAPRRTPPEVSVPWWKKLLSMKLFKKR